MMNFYETECKRQRQQDPNKSTISLGDSGEVTLALQRVMDCVKHNLSGEGKLLSICAILSKIHVAY